MYFHFTINCADRNSAQDASNQHSPQIITGNKMDKIFTLETLKSVRNRLLHHMKICFSQVNGKKKSHHFQQCPPPRQQDELAVTRTNAFCWSLELQIQRRQFKFSSRKVNLSSFYFSLSSHRMRCRIFLPIWLILNILILFFSLIGNDRFHLCVICKHPVWTGPVSQKTSVPSFLWRGNQFPVIKCHPSELVAIEKLERPSRTRIDKF